MDVVSVNISLNMDEEVHLLSQSYIDPRDFHSHPLGKGSRSSQPGDSARLNLISINTYQRHWEFDVFFLHFGDRRSAPN